MHKRIHISFGAALVLVGAILFASSAHAATSSSGTLASAAHLRDTAGLTQILATIPAGTAVSITAESGSWDHVVLTDGEHGWVSAALVKTATASSLATAADPAVTVEVATLKNNANIRQTAAVSAKNILTVLPSGTSVTITGTSGSWYKISYGSGKAGWVSQSVVQLPTAPQPASPAATPAGAGSAAATPVASLASASVFPSSVSEMDITQYWQQSVNALRSQKGLRTLAVSPALIGTAHTWATYLGINGIVTHTRPNGDTPEQWINTQGIRFTVQDSLNGWVTNYFTENIAEKLHVQPSLAGVKLVLDQVAQMFLAEGPGGSHYDTIYKPDWNSIGVGWYPIPNGDGTYTAYFVFHYGSLAA